MSLVCWEIVPSIFTFSCEYTAFRKENTSSENKTSLNKILKDLPLRTYGCSFRSPLRYLFTCQHHLLYSHIKLGLPLYIDTGAFHQMYCKGILIKHLYILQLVLQVSPLSLKHVCLVQSILQTLGQTEYVALLEVHLLLQLPLLWGPRQRYSI